MSDIQAKTLPTKRAGRSLAGRDPSPSTPDEEADSDLSSLAWTINSCYRRGQATALAAMEHFRRAGQLLLEVKERVGHGKFKAWVEANCKFRYRSAANYIEVHRRWDEVEALVRSKVQLDAPLTLKGVLETLARPRADTVSVPDPGPDRDGKLESSGEDVPDPIGLDRHRDDGGPERIPDREPREVRRSAPRPVTMDPTCSAVPETEDTDSSSELAVSPANPAAASVTARVRRAIHDHNLTRKHRTILDQLKLFGRDRAFSNDLVTWHLLRPVADELAARARRFALIEGGQPLPYRDGLHAPSVIALAIARPPGEWTLCDRCEGAGKDPGDGGPCPDCSGMGYRIDP